MKIRQTLQSCIPDAYYSNGVKANCMLFKICNMFDIDSQSFKQVNERKDMEEIKFDIPESGVLHCDKIILGDKFEISVKGETLDIKEKNKGI